MTELRLPKGADVGFRLVTDDEYGTVFTMHLYGSGRRGWFLLKSRYAPADHDPSPQLLRKGEWKTFLGLISACGFWTLLEYLPDRNDIINGKLELDGWYQLFIAGREGERYHSIQRYTIIEPAVSSVVRFCQQRADLLTTPPPNTLNSEHGKERIQ